MSVNIFKVFTCGFEFEFYSNYDREETAKQIAKAVGKKVIIPKVVVGLNKTITPVHSDFHPTADEWKLEPDYSGGKDMCELVTGPLEYDEARIYMIKVLDWIDKNGWTTKRTAIHINLGISDYKALNLKYDIMHMDRLKMCLYFNEDKVYDLFPHRKGNVYASSIKDIVPLTPFTFSINDKSVNRGSYITPSTKYYGINFIKQEKNYLEFRYLGGEDYQKQTKKILDLIEHFCQSVYDVLNDSVIGISEMSQLNSIIQKHKKIVTAFSDYKTFKLNFPDIKLTVDMSDNEEILKTYYNSTLREPLYDLIVYCNLKKGLINYDREVSKIQVKNATLTNCTRIMNIEFINCKINGIISHCDFHYCSIDNSIIEMCNLLNKNLVNFSKLKDCTIEQPNKILDCYIENKGFLTHGTYDKCIFRSGTPNKKAILKDCLFVEDTGKNKLNKVDQNVDKHNDSTHYGIK